MPAHTSNYPVVSRPVPPDQNQEVRTVLSSHLQPVRPPDLTQGPNLHLLALVMSRAAG